MDLSQTLRICILVFMQHIVHILLKQLIRSTDNSLNFKSSVFQVNMQLHIEYSGRK